MGWAVPEDKHLAVDLEKGLTLSNEDTNNCCGNEEGGVHKTSKASPTSQKKKVNKKSPKPPRPPRSASLESADVMLMKEISELVMLKKARIERLKALKKMKDAKASPSSSFGNLFFTAITIFFCLALVFQGKSVIPVELRTFQHIGSMVAGKLSGY